MSAITASWSEALACDVGHSSQLERRLHRPFRGELLHHVLHDVLIDVRVERLPVAPAHRRGDPHAVVDGTSGRGEERKEQEERAEEVGVEAEAGVEAGGGHLAAGSASTVAGLGT